MQRILAPMAMLAAGVLAGVWAHVWAGPAFAHTGVSATTGLAQGFLHPLSGLDHVLAMVAVGLYAAQLGGRGLWLLPSAFVVTMVVGGLVGYLGVALSMVEPAIGLSVSPQCSSWLLLTLPWASQFWSRWPPPE